MKLTGDLIQLAVFDRPGRTTDRTCAIYKSIPDVQMVVMMSDISSMMVVGEDGSFYKVFFVLKSGDMILGHLKASDVAS